LGDFLHRLIQGTQYVSTPRWRTPSRTLARGHWNSSVPAHLPL